jgi:glycosyltransferase involved in cell wall biosynthesis
VSELPTPPKGKKGFPWDKASPQTVKFLDGGEDWPVISIVTPSFNQEEYLEKTIRSVILQGYPNLEYFIIDGNSSDQSLEIIKRYQTWLSDWVQEPDNGQSEAINKGLMLASGEVFHWLNSDDYLLPGALINIAQFSRQCKDAAAWVGVCRRVSPDGKLLSTVIPRNLSQAGIADWSRKGFFYQPACFFSAQAWQEVGPLDESLQIAMDLDLWLRLADWGEFAVTDQVLAEAVIHPEAKTQRKRSAMQAETIYLQVKYGFPDVAADYLQSIIDRYRWSQLPSRILRWIGHHLKKKHSNPRNIHE